MDFPSQFPAESLFPSDTSGPQFWLCALLPPEWSITFCYRGLGLQTLPRSSRRSVWKTSGLNGQVFFFFLHTQLQWIFCISCLVTVIKGLNEAACGRNSVVWLTMGEDAVHCGRDSWQGLYCSRNVWKHLSISTKRQSSGQTWGPARLISTTHTVLDQPIKIHIQKINPTAAPDSTSIWGLSVQTCKPVEDSSHLNYYRKVINIFIYKYMNNKYFIDL